MEDGGVNPPPNSLYLQNENNISSKRSTNERGQRRIFKETAAKSKYYISKK